MNMVDARPLVSIGMPVYNEERFIRQALDSLLSQSFENFELIISDNASTDCTGDISLEYAAKDQRIRYYRAETNLGSIANCNLTFQLSRAKYFFWASGHDLRDETFISRCVEVLEDDKSIVLCYPVARWIESDGKLGEVIFGNVDTRGSDRMSSFHTIIWGLGYNFPVYGIIRSSSLKKTKLQPKTIGSDIVLLTELSFLGAFAQMSEPCLYMRKLSDYGNWEQYLLKSLGSDLAKRSSWYLYTKWIYEHIRVIARHGECYRRKSICIFSVILCILTKYRSVFHGLRSRRVKKANSDKYSQQ